MPSSWSSLRTFTAFVSYMCWLISLIVSMIQFLRLGALLGAAVLAFRTVCWSGPVFCPVARPMNEALFPPVWCSLTFCVLTKYNMIMRVEIEATERHSDQHWYSLSVGARPNFEGAPGWRTGSTQTHLIRLEVPRQCFNMHYGPNKACPNHREGGQWTRHYSRAV